MLAATDDDDGDQQLAAAAQPCVVVVVESEAKVERVGRVLVSILQNRTLSYA